MRLPGLRSLLRCFLTHISLPRVARKPCQIVVVLKRGDLTLEEAQKAVARGAKGGEGVVSKETQSGQLANEGVSSSARSEEPGDIVTERADGADEVDGVPKRKVMKPAQLTKEQKKLQDKERRKMGAAALPKSLSQKNTKLLSFGEDEEDIY